MTEATDPFIPGTWVKVWARVPGVDDYPVEKTRCHPEDLMVEVRNHGEDFLIPVTPERVETTLEIPKFVGRCPHVYGNKSEWADSINWRCTLHRDHVDELHVANSGSLRWNDDQTAYYAEDC